MEKEFVSYELAVKLKELGFDEPCFGYYEPNKNLNYIEKHILKDFPYLAKNSEWQDLCAAPTFSQAFKWFRDTHNCHYTINLNKKYVGIAYSSVVNFSIDEFDTYEEAELACLKKLIEIVESK